MISNNQLNILNPFRHVQNHNCHSHIVQSHNIKTILNIMKESSGKNTKSNKNVNKSNKYNDKTPIGHPVVVLCKNIIRDYSSSNTIGADFCISEFSEIQKFRYRYINVFNAASSFFKKLRVITKNKVVLNLQEIESDISLSSFSAILTHNDLCFFIHNPQFIYTNIDNCVKELDDDDENDKNENRIILDINIDSNDVATVSEIYGLEKAKVSIHNMKQSKILVTNPCKLYYSQSVYSKGDIINNCSIMKLTYDTKMKKQELYDLFVSNVKQTAFFKL